MSPGRGDQFVDIVMIATEARKQRRKGGSFVAIDELRRDAIHAVAERETKKGRFKNLDSALRTLHDACVRRLKPDISSVAEFDALLQEWLKTGSDRLSKVLERHARSAAHRTLIRTTFG